MKKDKPKPKVIALSLGGAGTGRSIFNAQQIEGVIRWARRAGWDLIDAADWHGEIPDAPEIAGLIYKRGSENQATLNALLARIPFSVRLQAGGSNTDICCVDTDWEAVGMQAAEYYLERGFRNFALAAYRTREWIQSLRVFKERIERAGGQCQAIQGMHLGEKSQEKVRKSVRRQLRKLNYPLGIFCANDRLAVRLCRWCIEEGIAVPEQAAILGYDNDSVTCGISPVALSSVDPYPEQQGFEAARLLQRMLDGETFPEGTLVRVPPSSIVTRRSTDITAIPDARAARALRYIWDHYADNIYAEDIAASCGMSRRNLDRHFKEALGRTAAQEITRRRLQRACELLVGGDMDAADIAARTGFGTPQYFNFLFKRCYGLTPQRYRERERWKH